MTDEQELLEIEHTLATGGADEYREHLAEDAIVIIPAQALDTYSKDEGSWKLVLHQQTPLWER